MPDLCTLSMYVANGSQCRERGKARRSRLAIEEGGEVKQGQSAGKLRSIAMTTPPDSAADALLQPLPPRSGYASQPLASLPFRFLLCWNASLACTFCALLGSCKQSVLVYCECMFLLPCSAWSFYANFGSVVEVRVLSFGPLLHPGHRRENHCSSTT